VRSPTTTTKNPYPMSHPRKCDCSNKLLNHIDYFAYD
jgi:hypothetical protein